MSPEVLEREYYQQYQTKLEFYQKKREAVEIFDKLIAKFEKENPDIEIVQNFNQDTVLKAWKVKNDLPPLPRSGLSRESPVERLS